MVKPCLYGVIRRYTPAMIDILRSPRLLLPAAFVVLLVLPACSSTGTPVPGAPVKSYEVIYTARLAAGDPVARVSIRTDRDARRLRELRFRFDPSRYSDFEADGKLDIDENEVTWRPPRNGGTLSYRVQVPHRRRNGAYDAMATDDWALFRGDDLFPPMRTSVTKGWVSESRLELELPKGWSAVTPYLSGDDELTFPINNPARAFDRPTGWMLAGKIGVRRGLIAGVRVAIAAPAEQGMRRMDVMAFLNWTLPRVVEVFPTMDARLVIVGAGDPMWRGGLSGPGSMFMHADRPLISENGTSSFLHELIHIAMGAAGSENDDWLVEGLAEYYSIRILAGTGTLSERRMELALADLATWGKDVDNLFLRQSTAEVTARAVTLLASLDAWLVENAPRGAGLDAVVNRMIGNGARYDYRALCLAAHEVMRGPVPMLDASQVPGAPALPECGSD